MPNPNTMTKDELIERLREAEALIEDQKIEIEQRESKLKELSARGAGWLVIAPNPTYEGRTLGIQFVRGQAFIRHDQRVSACRVEPMKETTIAKLGVSPDEAKAIRERERMSEAERAVQQLESDFGYKSVWFDGSETADSQMGKLIEERAKEYARALEMQEARNKAQDAIMPHFMGQSR